MLFDYMSAEKIKINETPVISVRELLQFVGQKRVFTTQPTVSVNEIAKVWREHKIGALLVVGDEDHLMGIVTERDGAWKVLAENRLPSDVKVGEIMTPLEQIVTVSVEDDILELARLFREHDFVFRHVPAVRNEDIYEGVASERDLFRYLLHLLEQSREEKNQ